VSNDWCPTSYLVDLHSDPPRHEKIPKPCGEVGRLSRNGYKLENVLGWKEEQYHDVQVNLNASFVVYNAHAIQRFVREQVNLYLSKDISFSKQPETALKCICENVGTQHILSPLG
jgi:hypothetical protein